MNNSVDNPEEITNQSEESAVSGVDGAIEQVAHDLQLNLPLTNLPLIDKIIALLTLIGGLGILGSTLADIFYPDRIAFYLYTIRLVAGFSFLGISYGLIHRQRWAIWWYSFLVVLALFINPVAALVPGLIVIYLYSQGHLFAESIFDRWVAAGWAWFKQQIRGRSV